MNNFDVMIEFITNPFVLIIFVIGFIFGALLIVWLFEEKRKKVDEKSATKNISPQSQDSIFSVKATTDSISEDIKLQRAKKMLMESEISNEAKNRFIAKMLHDIRNSLNIIMGMTQIVEEETGKSQLSINDLIVPINNAAKKLLLLTEDIAEFTTREKGGALISNRRLPFNLENVCKDIINEEKPSAEKNKTPIILSYSDELPKFFLGDSYKISQMLSFLFDYAIRFTKNRTIVVKVAKTKDNKNKIDEIPVEIRIEFGAESISPADIETAFDFTSEDFESAKKSGNIKLGLATCGYLAELFSGNLTFQINPDIGSIFTVTLYLQPKQLDQVQKTEKSEKPATENINKLDGKKALLAEDDPVNRQIEKIFLQRIGLIVDAVSDGSEAVEKFMQNNYDIIFMDCDMPIMDGFSATRRIREIENDGRKKTPIIAMTAYALSGDREKCLEAGMNDYISKPVNVNGLIEITLKNI